MKISHEQIIKLQKRIDISYEDAEKLLKKSKNDIDKAVVIYNKRKNSKLRKLNSHIKSFFNKFLNYRLKINRKEDLLLDLSIGICFLVLIILIMFGTTWLTGLILLLIIIASGGDVKIASKSKKEQGQGSDPKEGNVRSQAQRMNEDENASPLAEGLEVETSENNDAENEDNQQYNEITIE